MNEMEFLFVHDRDVGNGMVENYAAFNFNGQIVDVKLGVNLTTEDRRKILSVAGIELAGPDDDSVKEAFKKAFG